MTLSKVKVLFCMAAVLTLLFAPLALEISHAGALFGGGSGGSSGGSDFSGTTVSSSEPATYPNPEPATMLLFGAGAAGLVAYRKYRKKK